MESDHLDSPSAEDRKLAALLREQAPPLPPRAFSLQVLAALPPPPTRRLPLRRVLLCGAGAALGLAVAWRQQGFDGSAETVLQLAQSLLDRQVLVALALTAVSISVAFWRGPRTPHAQ